MYEISEDNGKTWKVVSWEYVENLLAKSQDYNLSVKFLDKFGKVRVAGVIIQKVSGS